MPKKDPRVDAYIAKSADFARPILRHLRALVHAACPDAQETMKWSFPHFDYKGMMCGMAAFKQHCTFGFWKGALIVDPKTGKGLGDAMGQFGRITKLADLPPDATIKRYVKAAMRLNDEGVPAPHMVRRRAKPPLPVPASLAAALRKNAKARAAFKAFSPSHRREYSAWIGEAKTDATRDKRVRQAIEWIAEGKGRHWRYDRSQ